MGQRAEIGTRPIRSSRERLATAALRPARAIERALQDIGGGHLVDDLGAPGARDVVGDQRAHDRGGRKPLVPERDRRRMEPGEIAREGARRLRARTLQPVHADGQADDQRERLEFLDLRAQRLGVLREGCPRKRDQRRRDAPLDVGQREPDRLGPEIDADQARLGGQPCGEGLAASAGRRVWRQTCERCAITTRRALPRRSARML